jgi:AbrB family looped-hinge helix DNA binding protein
VKEVEKMFAYVDTLVIDKQGRIVIPAKVRKDLGLNEGDMIRLEYQDGIIQIYLVEMEGDKK